MAGAGGQSGPDLIQELLESPQEFEFFQAVRIIEHMLLETTDGSHSSVGGDGLSARECLRFHALASLCFPPGQISSIKSRSDSKERNPGKKDGSVPSFEMTVPFMGLIGPGGALPQHYTSLVIERSHLRNKDYALQEFFDLFNHRVLSLFFRAWEKYRFPFGYERSLKNDVRPNDLFTRCLFSCVGLGINELRGRFPFDDQCVIEYGGFFARVNRSAIGLQQVVTHYLGFSVRVEQFVGQWLLLDSDNQSCLPTRSSVRGQNLCLGEDAVVGTCFWDIQSRVRLILGPLNWAGFVAMLPGTPRMIELQELVKFYVGIHIEFDIQLVLKKEDVPVCRLTSAPGEGSRLGWTTWLATSEKRAVDVPDATFRF